MSDIRLHSFFRSSTSIRVRAALGLKGLAYDYAAWNLRTNEHFSSEFLAVNPQGLVPALDRAMRKKEDPMLVFGKLTGKSADDLWKEYIATL